MSLAEEMLATMSVGDATVPYLADEEPHIVIDESRTAIVPARLKTIAVTGDKDIETVTFDCVRYWDGYDLSTFAIYLNYVLPDGTSGTYIPKSIVAEDDVYHFDWEIKNNITQKSGKISFAITAVKTKQNENGETVVDKQWSSLPNGDCSIALGLDISNVPDDEESADILAQMSAILEEMQGNILADLIVQSGGTDTAKVMSQAASSNTFSNAIKGNILGKIVSMDDVSPVEHKVPVKLRSKNLIPYPFYDTTKTENGVTFTDNGDGTITLNGTATGNSRFDFLRNSSAEFPNATYTLSGISGGGVTTYYIQMFSGSKYYDSLSSGSLTVTTDGNLTMITLYVKTGATFNNLVVKPQLELGSVATEYTPHVAEDTQVEVKSCGKNLIQYPYANNSAVDGGVTFTAQEDGGIRITGTCTKDTYMSLWHNKLFTKFWYSQLNRDGKSAEGYCASLRGTCASGTSDRVYLQFETYTGGGFVYVYVKSGETYDCVVYPQVEVGDTPTEYELYKEGETVTTTISDGAELASIAPNMTITTDNDGVIVEAQYNKDANKVEEKKEEELASVESRLYDLDERVTALEANICFQEGTQILMADGTSKKIEDVEYGDMIMTWDIENQCTMPCKAFGNLYTGLTSAWKDFCFDNGSILRIYRAHRIFNADKGFLTHSDSWLIGQKAIASDGNTTTYCYQPKMFRAAIPSKKYALFCETGMFFANGILCGHQICQPLDIYKRTRNRIPLTEEEIADIQDYADARDGYYLVEVQNLDYLRESLPYRKEQDIANRKIDKYKKKLADRDYKTIKAMQGKLTDSEIDENISACEELRKKVNVQEAIVQENEEMILDLQQRYNIHPKSLQEIESLNVLKAVAKAREKNLNGR